MMAEIEPDKFSKVKIVLLLFLPLFILFLVVGIFIGYLIGKNNPSGVSIPPRSFESDEIKDSETSEISCQEFDQNLRLLSSFKSFKLSEILPLETKISPQNFTISSNQLFVFKEYNGGYTMSQPGGGPFYVPEIFSIEGERVNIDTVPNFYVPPDLIYKSFGSRLSVIRNNNDWYVLQIGECFSGEEGLPNCDQNLTKLRTTGDSPEKISIPKQYSFVQLKPDKSSNLLTIAGVSEELIFFNIANNNSNLAVYNTDTKSWDEKPKSGISFDSVYVERLEIREMECLYYPTEIGDLIVKKHILSAIGEQMNHLDLFFSKKEF